MTDLPLFPGETILFETRQHWTAVKGYYTLAILLGGLGLLMLPMLIAIPNLEPIEKFLFGPLPIGISIAVFVAAKLSRTMHEY